VDIAFGLTMGNLPAGTRARIGSYGTRQDLRETLRVPLSEMGLDIARQAEEYKGSKHLVVVPSRLMEHPKFTIGLGDAFLAGVQICFMDRQLEKQSLS
jgi:ADP-dependent phosphofructokinase/glucokinase